MILIEQCITVVWNRLSLSDSLQTTCTEENRGDKKCPLYDSNHHYYKSDMSLAGNRTEIRGSSPNESEYGNWCRGTLKSYNCTTRNRVERGL